LWLDASGNVAGFDIFSGVSGSQIQVIIRAPVSIAQDRVSALYGKESSMSGLVSGSAIRVKLFGQPAKCGFDISGSCGPINSKNFIEIEVTAFVGSCELGQRNGSAIALWLLGIGRALQF
jgi:hypothetical protein